MPNYLPRDDNENIPNDRKSVNLQGGNRIVEPKEEQPNEPVEMLGGVITDKIIEDKKAHKMMINAILKMKPKDVHILKKAAKYFLDNPDELTDPIDEDALEDISKTINVNDLADIENDFEMCDGGELNGCTLIEELARLFNDVPNILKIINV